MTRRTRLWLAYAYLVAAGVTFNIGYPINCGHMITRHEYASCVSQNVYESFWAAAAWPAFWVWEIVR